MIKIVIHDKNTALVYADDNMTLNKIKSRTDGYIDDIHRRVYVHVRSLLNVFKINGHEFEMSDEAKEVIRDLHATVTKRSNNIRAIRAQYPDKITFSYKTKGKYPPLEHQKVMYNAMVYSNVAAILADPGTCKTGSYLWAVDTMIMRGDVKRCLVITLSGLKKNVLEEMGAQVPHLKGVVMNSSKHADNILNKKFKRASKNDDYDIYISNYESMRHITDLFEDDFFEMVILDEAHRVGSAESQQTAAILNKFENLKYKYIITGTLHANNLVSFFMPFRIMGHETIPYSNYYAFRSIYMRAVDDMQRIWVPRKGAKDIVKKIVAKVSVVFKKEECLDDLPERICTTLTCNLEGDQKKLYRSMQDELSAIIEDKCSLCVWDRESCDRNCDAGVCVDIPIVLRTKLRQIASGFYRDNYKEMVDGKEVDKSNIIVLKSNPKLKLLMQTLGNIPSDKKVIIWCESTFSVETIVKTLKKKYGKKTVMSCYGSDDAFDKNVEFRENNAIRYIVASRPKMGVGLNMQFSSYSVFYENSDSFVGRDQAEGRQHRKGQTNLVTNYDLAVEDTIDVIISKNLQNKESLSTDLSSLARIASYKK
jgi:SNF2 family DNA or RNA helicase